MTHIGIIMDGNRRWAKEKGLPTLMGHMTGADNVKEIVKIAGEEGIEYLTLWALSKENLIKRTKEEVDKIISLIDNIERYLGQMMDEGLRFKTIGDIDSLPKKSVGILRGLEERTKNNKGLTLTIALIYSGQDEIIRATRKIINSGINPEDLTNKEFRRYLDTSFLPNPDLIIRTGGDVRHSGFLLFDSEYSEYYFTKKKWPEFDKEEFLKALDSLDKAKRNFGK